MKPQQKGAEARASCRRPARAGPSSSGGVAEGNHRFAAFDVEHEAAPPPRQGASRARTARSGRPGWVKGASQRAARGTSGTQTMALSLEKRPRTSRRTRRTAWPTCGSASAGEREQRAEPAEHVRSADHARHRFGEHRAGDENRARQPRERRAAASLRMHETSPRARRWPRAGPRCTSGTPTDTARTPSGCARRGRRGRAARAARWPRTPDTFGSGR